jgi:soluble lytic murein transglycosylase
MAARAVALETARATGSAVTRATAWGELGRLRLAAGDSARGRLALEEAIRTPAALGAVTGARILTELGPTPVQWQMIGDIYARHGNPSRAAEAYQKYLESGSGSASSREAVRLRRGRALFDLGRYDTAERELLALANDAASPRVGAQALYLAGRAQYRRGRSSAGQETLSQLPGRFPGQPAVTEGLYLLADLKHDALAIDEARRYYRQAAEVSPSLYQAGLALMRLGGLDLLEGDYEGAVEVYQHYRTLHPRGRRWEQATYWAAQASTALGRAETARSLLEELRARDPLSYYGMRASVLLDRPLLDVPMGPSPEPAESGRVTEGLRRVDVLAELGRRDDLVQEVQRLRARVESDRADAYALAEALNARGYTLTGINLGWSLYRRDGAFNPRLLGIIYPFPFRDMVTAESRAQGLDPYLVAGLIRRESAFNPTVASSAGAIGLMQIMPETGRSLARAVGLSRFEPELLRQPEVNLHLGTRYLAQMLERYDDSLTLVLSAYNAGPTRAAAWREFPEARDPELLMERVPFAETREYIRNVQLHRAVYRALYPGLTQEVDGAP